MADKVGKPELDVICIGRSSVDLYGSQVGGAHCILTFHNDAK